MLLAGKVAQATGEAKNEGEGGGRRLTHFHGNARNNGYMKRVLSHHIKGKERLEMAILRGVLQCDERVKKENYTVGKKHKLSVKIDRDTLTINDNILIYNTFVVMFSKVISNLERVLNFEEQ